jgi:hypothetical protein
MGAVAKASHTVLTSLVSTGGKVRAEAQQDLAEPHRITLAMPGVEPGDYSLRLKIREASGKECSQSTQRITLHPGPLH